MRTLPRALGAAAFLLAALTACESETPTAAPSSAPPAPTRTVCGSPVQVAPLPEWARAGFSDDGRMPHVMGDRGDIVAAIFGHPLAVSRPDGSNNKILWVSRVQSEGDLIIEAKLDGSTAVESRKVARGPGPSIIDLPQAGCWRLTLTWGEHTDTMDLVYR